jgi:hypothetical protein
MLGGVDWYLVTDFLNRLSVPYPRVKQSKKLGPTGCPETSVTNYQSTVCNNPEERLSKTKKRKQNHCMKTRYLLKNDVFLENEGIAVTIIKNFLCISNSSGPETRMILLRRQTTEIRQLLLRSFLQTSNRRSAESIFYIGTGCK